MKIVSKKIRESARGEECAFRFENICQGRTETVVLCHINTRFKGIGIKSPDIFAAYGCYHCHAALDQRTIELNYRDILNAMVETQMKLFEKGLIQIV